MADEIEAGHPKQRIFAKVTKASRRDRGQVVSEGGGHDTLEHSAGYRRIREVAADAVPAAMVVVHTSGTVALINATARRLFGLSDSDIGRAFQDLEISDRPAELRSAVEQVQKEARPLVLAQVAWKAGPVGFLDIHLVPLADASGRSLGVALTFIDASLARRFQDDLEHSNRDLETAYELLQSTNEEFETTNAELQSTIEELEKTNAELEAMKAELHSIHEELQANADELRLRTGELAEVNEFLESLLTSQRGGFVAVDRELRILVWNDRSAELWGVRPDEAPGRHFLNLEIGLPVEDLREPMMAVLAGDSDQETVDLSATSRRGREIRCRVSLTPLLGRDRDVRGVIVVVEEGEGDAVTAGAG